MTEFTDSRKPKSLVLNAFVEMCKCTLDRPCTRFEADPSNVGSGHQSPGLWRHPDDHSWQFNEASHWVELAKLLEEAKFHGIFIADVLGIQIPHWLRLKRLLTHV
jgi:alkanesulfonate monooxygenase